LRRKEAIERLRAHKQKFTERDMPKPSQLPQLLELRKCGKAYLKAEKLVCLNVFHELRRRGMLIYEAIMETSELVRIPSRKIESFVKEKTFTGEVRNNSSGVRTRMSYFDMLSSTQIDEIRHLGMNL